MQSVLNNRYHKLFQNLIWPAVAGNVIWATFSIGIEYNYHNGNLDSLWRILSLLILSIYLVSDWMTSEKELRNLKSNYWIGDSFHAFSIVLFSISAYNNNQDLMYWSVILALTINSIAHFGGCWEDRNIKSFNKLFNRLSLGFSNVIGISFFIFFYWIYKAMWVYPASLFIVLILYYLSKFLFNKSKFN